MKFSVTQKGIKVDNKVSVFLDEKLSKLDNKFKVKITRADVVLKKRKFLFCAEVKIQAKNLRIFGEGESDGSIFAAIEKSIGKVEAQLQKHKEKVKKRNSREALVRKQELSFFSVEGENSAAMASSADEADRGTVEVEYRVLKPMAIEDAVLQLGMMANKLFDVFVEPRTNDIYVIYRKGKERYGIIKQQK